MRLDNAPQAKVHTDCFIASLWVCFASHTESCIVIVMYHFNRGSVHFTDSDVSFSNINILYTVLVVI